MSYEAIARVRKRGSIGIFEAKWLTVETDSVSDAIKSFNAIGYEVNTCRVFTQEQANEMSQQF